MSKQGQIHRNAIGQAVIAYGQANKGFSDKAIVLSQEFGLSNEFEGVIGEPTDVPHLYKTRRLVVTFARGNVLSWTELPQVTYQYETSLYPAITVVGQRNAFDEEMYIIENHKATDLHTNADVQTLAEYLRQQDRRVMQVTVH